MPKEGQDLILAGALLSIIANPLLFAVLDRRAARELAAKRTAADASTPPQIPADVRDHVILIGYGRVGSELAPPADRARRAAGGDRRTRTTCVDRARAAARRRSAAMRPTSAC